MTESKVIEIIRKYLKLVPVCGDDEALDMTLKALTQYQLLEKHLTDIFGPEFSIETVVEEPVNAKILTYEDAKAWEEYKAIGTPEECRKSVEICKSMIERNITPENMEEYMKFEDECVKNGFTFNSLLEAREKQIPYKPSQQKLVWGIGKCKCGVEFLDSKTDYCGNCGQKLDWSDEE